MRTPAVATPGADLAPRSDALPRLAVAGLFAVGVLLGALAIPVLAAGGMGLFLQGRVMPRVEVAGVDIGLLTAAEAEARLAKTLPDYAAGSVAITLDGTTTQVPYAQIGTRPRLRGAGRRRHGRGPLRRPVDRRPAAPGQPRGRAPRSPTR